MSSVLYELINSLTTSEKVYFKRNAKTHAGNDSKNYLKIYKAYENLEHYDKSTLPNLFKGTTIDKYLSSEVNYLKEKLLISLFNFNMNRTKRNQIQKGILIVEVLASKGFQKEALKKLKPIKRTAYKQEEFTWILRLIELEEIILFKEGIMGYKDKLEKLHLQRSKVTSTIQNLNNYRLLREEIRELQFSENLLTDGPRALNELQNNPLISDSKNCMSIKAKEQWYYIQVLLNYLKRDFETGLSISADYVEFMNQNRHLFDINKLLPVLSNYIYHAALSRNHHHFEIGKKILADLPKKEVPPFYMNYILYTRSMEFSYYTNDVNLMEKYLSLTSDLIEHDLEHYEEPQIQYLFLLIVRSAIVLKKNDLAMYYSNLWYRRGVLVYRKVQARIFSLIINFELNHLELVQSEIVLLKKLEKKNQREKKLIKAFYSFLNSILKHPERKNILINKLQNDLKLIAEKNEGYFDFISFDYYQWSLRLQ